MLIDSHFTGENAIIIISGANLKLTVDDVMMAESLIATSKVVACQLEIRPEVTLAALRLAKQYRGKGILLGGLIV